MATSANITYGKLYIVGKSKLCWFQMCVNDVGRLSGREDMSKTKLALNPRLRLEVFRVTVKRPSKVGQRKVRSLVRDRNLLCTSSPLSLNYWSHRGLRINYECSGLSTQEFTTKGLCQKAALPSETVKPTNKTVNPRGTTVNLASAAVCSTPIFWQ